MEDLRLIDKIKQAWEDMDKEVFKEFLEESVAEYLMENKGNYVSLDSFLKHFNCVEFPDEEIYDYESVQLLKKWELEFLKKQASKNSNIAYEMYKDATSEGQRGIDVQFTFSATIKDDMEIEYENEEENKTA